MVKLLGYSEDGQYTIDPDGTLEGVEPFKVYCGNMNVPGSQPTLYATHDTLHRTHVSGYEADGSWGGKNPGMEHVCGSPTPGSTCNCNGPTTGPWQSDEGNWTDVNDLPVTELCFGDTGHSHEELYYTLGKLIC